METYKMGKKQVMFMYIITPVFLFVFTYLLIMPFVSENEDLIGKLFFVPTSLVMIVLTIVTLLDTIKGKVMISSDTLSLRSTFINRDLKFKEIKGFITKEHYIFVLAKNPRKKRIKISIYLQDSHRLMMWLESNFCDLNQVNKTKRKTEFLNNLEYGRTKKERVHKLKQAKKLPKS